MVTGNELILGCVISGLIGFLMGYLSWRDEVRAIRSKIKILEKLSEYAWKSKRNGSDTCAVCGDSIPEGRQVCPKCEEGRGYERHV